MSPLVGARLLPFKDCDRWPLTHRELIRPLSSLRSYANVLLVGQATILPNKRSEEGWVDTKREQQQDPLGTDHYGGGRGTQEKFLHRPYEVFHRNLSNAHQKADWNKTLL